jgi:DNA-binding transcriptional ArsR family regulator
MLEDGDLCACQVIAVLKLAPSTVSRHIAELTRADLVTERKQGRWVHYALASGPDVDALLDPIRRTLTDDPQICDDRAVAQRLRAIPVEVLCEAGRDVTRLDELPEVRSD